MSYRHVPAYVEFTCDYCKVCWDEAPTTFCPPEWVAVQPGPAIKQSHFCSYHCLAKWARQRIDEGQRVGRQ